MPLRTAKVKEEDPKVCPRCSAELVAIDGKLTKWLNCPGCKWKKLVGKEGGEVITVRPMEKPDPKTFL